MDRLGIYVFKMSSRSLAWMQAIHPHTSHPGAAGGTGGFRLWASENPSLIHQCWFGRPGWTGLACGGDKATGVLIYVDILCWHQPSKEQKSKRTSANPPPWPHLRPQSGARAVTGGGSLATAGGLDRPCGGPGRRGRGNWWTCGLSMFFPAWRCGLDWTSLR